MAEQQQEQGKSGGVIGAIAAGIAGVWNAITRDGTVPAAWRQGADELAMALRAFPETIHAEEPGTILNPTQGEIADRRTLPSPSEIAKDKQPYQPEQGHEHDHSRGR